MIQRDEPVKLSEDGNSVLIIDQTLLPNRKEILSLNKEEECWNAIKRLQVRGAPCLGVFAAYAIYVLAKQYKERDYSSFKEKFHRQSDYLNSSRPTAVNLSWALKEMEKVVDHNNEKSIEEIVSLLLQRAKEIDMENLEMTRRIAEYGVTLIKDGDGILTHCNAGALACMGYGTATAPMFLAHEKGMHIHVFADETRPLLQGARLTSYELQRAGVDVTLICDNMASIVMKQGKIQAVMVGCDRIAANGDFANKIGTSGVAILAKHYGIPMYTLGPSSTIDFNTLTGEDIQIEERDPNEIKTMWYKEPMALDKVKCFNPAFDVTDHELLTAIVTEKGIVYPPFDVNLKKLFKGED